MLRWFHAILATNEALTVLTVANETQMNSYVCTVRTALSKPTGKQPCVSTCMLTFAIATCLTVQGVKDAGWNFQLAAWNVQTFSVSYLELRKDWKVFFLLILYCMCYFDLFCTGTKTPKHLLRCYAWQKHADRKENWIIEWGVRSAWSEPVEIRKSFTTWKDFLI